MDDVLREALEPVLRDLARAGHVAPVFDSTDWMSDDEYAATMMWSSDGTGSSVSVRRSAPLPERVVQAADRVQEWAIEGELWTAGRTNWPPCPRHPANHPLEATLVRGNAVWVCPTDEVEIAAIGGQ
ncbi:hypothetical protein [Nocardioides renjunii]|uniref:hypothetical protein n=1 Tax=Nocardioides renjunii TaxID=3095075 RepID=UPI002AFF9DCC|nr:hypothetical protein [Nocardioides sp. S-34]WQQ20760.1 hypothetical protein SHK17_12690 [Nocardioides sp. S-34]